MPRAPDLGRVARARGNLRGRRRVLLGDTFSLPGGAPRCLKHAELLIVGSGPAGLTAAIYAARANLNPLVVEGLGRRWPAHAHHRRRELPRLPRRHPRPRADGEVPRVRPSASAPSSSPPTSTASTSTVRRSGRGSVSGRSSPRSIVISTGATARMLGLPPSSGCSATACRPARPATASSSGSSRSRSIGGGDSAVEEAIFLTKFATSVTVVHRRDELRASKIMQDRAFANPKISFRWNAAVDEMLGDTKVEALRLRDTVTGDVSDLAVNGVFVAIGHTPNTSLFVNQLDLDENGYIVTAPVVDRDVGRGCLRGRRRAGPRVPPGDHRRRHRLHGRDRGRALARGAAPRRRTGMTRARRRNGRSPIGVVTDGSPADPAPIATRKDHPPCLTRF